jgi:hypothetical protein
VLPPWQIGTAWVDKWLGTSGISGVDPLCGAQAFYHVIHFLVKFTPGHFGSVLVDGWEETPIHGCM